MMRSKFISGLFTIAAFSSFSIIKQPASVSELNKALIGEKKINFSADHDVIFNSNIQLPFTSIILTTRMGPIQMKYLKIYYNSGHVQDVPYNRLLKVGTINAGTALNETGVFKIEFGYEKDIHTKTNPHPMKRAILSIWGYY
jgi:hypothetical protein